MGLCLMHNYDTGYPKSLARSAGWKRLGKEYGTPVVSGDDDHCFQKLMIARERKTGRHRGREGGER